MTVAATVFFLLVASHFFVDFALQGNSVAATAKNKFIEPVTFGIPWQYWMLGHVFAHGLFVAVFTQNPFIGLAEVIFHSIVDYMKCAKWIGIHTDQFLHITSKVVWVILYFQMKEYMQ